MNGLLGLEGLYVSRRRSETAPDSRPCSRPPPAPPSAPEPQPIRRQDSDHLDSNGRRRSVSDPTRKTTPQTGAGGLLGKLGSFLSRSTSSSSSRVYSSGKNYNLLSSRKLLPFHTGITASYSGPHGGLVNCGASLTTDDTELTSRCSTRNSDAGNIDSTTDTGVQGCSEKDPAANHDASKWRLRTEAAYGMSLSLYEYINNQRQECTGDPIADVFAIRTTCNSCVMAVADGVGWGQGARRAARCAIKGVMEHTWNTLYTKDNQPEPMTTLRVFKCLREAIDEAQDLIIDRNGSMTTLCLAVVADMADDTTSKALCVVNVGDSLAFVYSHQHGVKEVTKGCREYNLHRNVRFCDGALGPCFGDDPDLGNLTFSITTVEDGDIVFLTSDGVSDNFDPVIAREAVANSNFRSGVNRAEIIFSDWRDGRNDTGRMPALSPRERQEAMTRTMEMVISKTKLPNENVSSASSLCSKLLQYAVNLTVTKRDAHEATNNIIDMCEKERLANKMLTTGKEALYQHARGLPGKLDHATVVAYAVGGRASTDGTKPRDKQRKQTRKEPSSYLDVTVGNEQNKAQISLID